MCGPGGGAGDAGASFDDPSNTEAHDPNAPSSLDADDFSSMRPSGREGEDGFEGFGQEGMGPPSPTDGSDVGSTFVGPPISTTAAIKHGLATATQKNPNMMGLSAIVPGMGFLAGAAALANAPVGSLSPGAFDDPGPGPEGSGGDWEAEEAVRVAREKAAADKAAADKAAADKKTADTATMVEEKAVAGVKDDFDAKAASAAKESRRRALAAATTAQPTIRTSPRGILGAPAAIVRKRLLGA